MATDVPHPQDLLDLTGRVAIVTGASQGIGAGIAARFATAGARVVVHYRRDRQAAKHVVTKIKAAGGTAVAITAKLDTEAGVASFFAEADDRLGPVDILINNAGQNFPLHPLAEISLDEWQAMFRDNLESTFLGDAGRGTRDARAGWRRDREHRLDLCIEPGDRPQPLQQREGRCPGVHPVMCAGARPGRHPRECRFAGADP